MILTSYLSLLAFIFPDRSWNGGKGTSTNVYFVNNYGAGGGVEMTSGGSRKRGFGREKGLEASEFYTK
jgi:acyl-CoA reductase-like NAD-dependent aldehyde dehydrogenase